jgi:protein subunit release factor A
MIPEAELKVETLRRDQRGGQHVGTDPCDVRVTHIPTGITATVGCCRSQYRNRNIAVEMIEAALTHADFGR